jgi:hypothetical protein
MNTLWIRLRLPLAIFTVLIMTLALARLFSGPEDGWVRNEKGEWEMHGSPSEPSPATDYREPATNIILPVAFLLAFAAPLFMLNFFKSRNRLTFNAATTDQKLFGYIGASLVLFGAFTGLGLLAEMIFGFGNSADQELVTMIVIIALTLFALSSLMLGVLFFALKRISSDHYQIMKTQRELAETITTLSRPVSA